MPITDELSERGRHIGRPVRRTEEIAFRLIVEAGLVDIGAQVLLQGVMDGHFVDFPAFSRREPPPLAARCVVLDSAGESGMSLDHQGAPIASDSDAP